MIQIIFFQNYRYSIISSINEVMDYAKQLLFDTLCVKCLLSNYILGEGEGGNNKRI